MWRVTILLACLGLRAIAVAQVLPPGPEGSASYLLRMERTRFIESVCVLLNENGQYHLERQAPNRVRVFEGRVAESELRDVVRIVSGDLLFHLQQKQIPDLMIKSDDERLILEIHRPGAWQQLFFSDSASRRPFREAMDPLLKWFDTVNKRKGREYSEEARRNNCLPPSTTEFAKREAPRTLESHRTPPKSDPVATAALPATNTASYTLLMYETRLLGYQPQATCLVVSAEGGFHMVTQTKSYDKGLSNAVLDGSLSPPQISSLHSILDAPELANEPEEKHQGEIIMTTDGFFTRMFIPRGLATQKVAAWKSYRIVNQVLSSSVEDHGSRTLAPLREWLKANIDLKAAVPTTIPSNPRCFPGE